MLKSTLLALAALAIGAISQAQVPPDIAAELKRLGPGVYPADTAKLYRPLQPHEPYPGVKVARSVSFGPDPMNVVDIFSPEKGGSRPVLIYVSGGAGNRIEQIPNGDAFYDNIMLWANKHGMMGVNMQRRGGPGLAWDDPGKDVGLLMRWIQANISKYKGKPDRVFIWAHSAGNPSVATYVGRPELYTPKGVGLKGVIFMAPAPFNIYPAVAPQPPPGPGRGPGGGGRGDGKGGPPPQAKGGDGKGGGKGRGGPAPVDPAVQQARSLLPGLQKAKVSYFLAAAELDPPAMPLFLNTLKEQLCMAGNCPTYPPLFKDHSHASEVYSPNTADTTVTDPILKWMKTVK
jgi:hypothetical protein